MSEQDEVVDLPAPKLVGPAPAEDILDLPAPRLVPRSRDPEPLTLEHKRTSQRHFFHHRLSTPKISHDPPQVKSPANIGIKILLGNGFAIAESG